MARRTSWPERDAGGEELLHHQVWFNRHMNLRWRVTHGKLKVVDPDSWEKLGGDNSRSTSLTVFMRVQRRRPTRIELEFGPKKFGPWNDFEWGMINGKLSALRWVLGDEWDMLDT